jgi:ABC-type lipoprotein release transport system permease subunit
MILKLAWRNIWRHTRRTLITAFAMAFGVALCMGFMAWGDGVFVMVFDSMVTKSLGHAQIHAKEFPKQRALYETIEDADELKKKLEALDEVTAAASRVFGYALLAAGDEATGGQVTGIDPGDEVRMRDLSKSVIDGEYLPSEAKQKMLLGFELAETMKAKVGDEVVVVTQAADGSMGNELYTVNGILKTGAIAVDKLGAFVHLEDARSLLVLEGQVHEIALMADGKLAVPKMMKAVKPHISDKLLLRSWGDVNPMAKQFVSLQDAMFLIIAFIIFGVAALGILNTMLMSVFERTKELGVLIALGLKPRQIVQLIMAETFFLTLISVFIGFILGTVVDWWLVTYGIDMGSAVDFSGMRMEPVIKGVVRPAGVIVTVVILFFVSFFASLWPAIRAARLQPVAAMREQ